LKQGLTIAEQLGRHEDEAKICHRLGLSLWGKGDLDECQLQLHRAAEFGYCKTLFQIFNCFCVAVQGMMNSTLKIKHIFIVTTIGKQIWILFSPL
jgi:hypothetical protein